MDYQNGNYPFGLAMADFMDDAKRPGTNSMTEAEKENMIFEYKDSDKEKERERIRAIMDDEMKAAVKGPGIG